MILTPFLSPFIFVGYYVLIKKCVLISLSLLIVPIVFCIYMGAGSLVINRNVAILIPFVLPVFSVGIAFTFNILRAQFKKFTSVLLAGLLLIPLMWPLSLMVSSDLQADSRIIAAQWVKSNISAYSSVGNNEFCSGPSPAQIVGMSVKNDPNFQSGYDYYLINSYWNSSLSPYYWNKGLLQTINLNFLHFYNFNDRSLWKNDDPLITLYEGFQRNGYVLLKIFKGSGPDIYLFKKIDIQ